MDRSVASELLVQGSSVVSVRVRTSGSIRWSGKRLCDLFISFFGLVLAAPIIVAVAALLWSEGKGAVVYSQIRIGKNGRPFRLYKLRTMVVDADERLAALRAADPAVDREWKSNQKLKNDPRVTIAGVFLRRSCIDELPQLINVLRGDMSVVGPRPITEAQIGEYGRRFPEYTTVRPGLTGLWQVSRERHPTFSNRIAADWLYIRRQCFWLDLRIMFRTVPVVIMGKGSQ